MALDLKYQLRSKLEAIAPEYGLVELTYLSFARCLGYQASPLSAADAVEAVSALLDVSGGVQIEVEAEGTLHGGEWFGGQHAWEGGKQFLDDPTKMKQQGSHDLQAHRGATDEHAEVPWWIKNFWTAYDALGE